jgi:Flp pilus assembly protein CpaB
MNRKYQSLLTHYRREIAVTSAVLASLLTLGKLAPIGTHDVVVAKRDIPVGAQIAESDLGTVKSRSWPNEITSPVEVVGKTLNHSIPTGGLITHSDFVSADAAIAGRLQVAVPLSVSDSQLVSGGSHIDLYSITGLIAVDAIVISVSKNQKSGLLGNDASANAVLAISSSEVLRLAAAKENGNLTIALR